MKKVNEYYQEIRDINEVASKAVLGGVLVSFIHRFFLDDITPNKNVSDIILEEWNTLYGNDIIPQKPPTSKKIKSTRDKIKEIESRS